MTTEYPGRKNAVNPGNLLTVLAMAGVLLIYHETVLSMVATWYRSETYTHGFLILPFVIYMIWTKRESIGVLQQQPSFSALIGLCVLGFVWLVAELASVLVVTQYTLVAMLPLVVAAVLGYRIMFALAFPLAYLFFAVPFGEILIPPLINFTADFTVGALQLSGVPVYREGTYFSLPTGNWSVVEACSGLRYLIASVTLGTLYAYLTYRSLSRRLIFIALSIIVPILANGMRAYLIVMTGHLSDMTLAVGVDHLIYGWVFFGIVMLALFWIGAFWREDTVAETEVRKLSNRTGNTRAAIGTTAAAAGAVLLVGLIWPLYAAYLESDSTDQRFVSLDLQLSDYRWRAGDQAGTDWEPIYIGEPVRFYRHYVDDHNNTVSLYVTHYPVQKQGDELISSGNILITEMDRKWRILSETQKSLTVNSHNFLVRQTELRSFPTNLLVWRWYSLGDDETTINPYMAKIILAKNRLLSRSESGTEIIVAAPFSYNMDEARPILERFMADMLPDISASLMRIHDDPS